MAYVTITYHPGDKAQLRSRLTIMAENCREISSRRCLSPVSGLISQSFCAVSESYASKILQLFAGIPVWIKHGLKAAKEDSVVVVDQEGPLVDISFGYLASNRVFLSDQSIFSPLYLSWKTNVSQEYVAIRCLHERCTEFRLTATCLEKYFIVAIHHPRLGVHTMMLPLRTPPKCYDTSRIACTRKLDFQNISASCLSDSSALCLTFANETSFHMCTKVLIDLFKLDCHVGYFASAPMLPNPCRLNPCLSDFWSSYAYQTLITLGHRITHPVRLETLQKITMLSNQSQKDQYPDHEGYLKLMAIYYQARQNRFFDINLEYDRVRPLSSSLLFDKWVYVPRIYLTPYGIFPLPVKPIRGNRVVREKDRFGPTEHFCRVILRDTDLSQPRQDFVKMHTQWIRSLLLAENLIRLGNKQYEFLLFSNSQLRDRSFWFYAPYLGCRAENIRHWMGDFSRENCIGKRVARMGQSFTGTTPTIKLAANEMEQIEDKDDEHGRTFTDGVGKISPMALQQALKMYRSNQADDEHLPCVIQIRLNGLKGVLVNSPELNDRGVLIQYRPSQLKFDVDHHVLEIAKHFTSGMLFLNRQVIVLLENMGVKQHTFLQLQNQARLKISMSLLGNKTAGRVLEQHVRCYDWQKMRSGGIQLTQEPFVRSLLLVLAKDRLRRLKERSHVPISLSDGRMLVGVVDETNSLQYGQIFIQLRDLNGERQILHSRQVLVTKNPAHFPGDVRKLEAVDCPALHYLDECVVFPAQGPRPHPNEISGSDTDGDEFWVCWNEELVRNATIQHEPSSFDAPKKAEHPGSITMVEIADFLIQYLSSDSLGILSNRHLACCALHGPSHDHAIRLARAISDAVDFPKTGILPKIPEGIIVPEYPDFMETRNKKLFISDSSLGVMYRQVKEVWQIHSSWIDGMDTEQVNIEKRFIIEGHQNYLGQAGQDFQYYSTRVNIILAMYNLENEYELITGCHSCVEEETKNNDSVETALLEFRHLLNEMRQRFTRDGLSNREQKKKASAWYYVAYRAGTTLSFAWIMSRLMSDINNGNRDDTEDNKALKSIGEAVQRYGFADVINQLAQQYLLTVDETDKRRESVKLGDKFLKIIGETSASDNEQLYAHRFLIYLHRIALNIL